jgi:hypothetical protein
MYYIIGPRWRLCLKIKVIKNGWYQVFRKDYIWFRNKIVNGDFYESNGNSLAIQAIKKFFIQYWFLYLSTYSTPPNTGLSGIRMVIFRTIFLSGFQMVSAILFLLFEIRTGYFLTSLDRFGMNKLFLWPLLIKRFRLRTTIWNPDLCPDFKW